jgi:hypothetical protein
MAADSMETLMKPSPVWKLVGVVVLALGALLVIFGLNLMPTQEVAITKGSIAPWRMTWAMIWTTVLMTVVLAGFLFSAGGEKSAAVHNSKLKT